jgi:hypothetical protein
MIRFRLAREKLIVKSRFCLYRPENADWMMFPCVSPFAISTSRRKQPWKLAAPEFDGGS